MKSTTETAYRRPASRPGALRLDANEGPAVASSRPLPALDGELLRRYPSADALEADLAMRFGIDPACVLVTAGGDDVIDRCCRRYLSGGRELLATRPTFEMFARHARLAGGSVRGCGWWEGPYPVGRIAGMIGKRTGLLAVVSPNNPTGAAVTPDELRSLRATSGDKPLLVDAAYAEFAADDLTSTALALPATLVLRTFSKAWGLAGLRVGYVLGPPDMIAALRSAGQPYAVAGPSAEIARRSLAQDEPAVTMAAARVRTNRQQLSRKLADHGARPLPSEANFVLCRPRDADFLQAGLASLGFAVRTWPDDPVLHDRVRITCPAAADEQAGLLRALDTIHAPDALLLDMDGVIADEGPSYRECIRAVAAGCGVSLSRTDIAGAKAAGGASNDWLLTRDLLRANGVDLSLDEVTRRFQAVYLGDGDTPGLCERERLIPAAELIAALADRLPLGIVTGRPRAEAERFLADRGLERHFGVLVAMEDAPAKPSPEPVRRALAALNARTAWLVGDTPDDMNAAAAAGVLPLGVLPPDPADGTGAALVAAGAARIIPDLSSLQELLS